LSDETRTSENISEKQDTETRTSENISEKQDTETRTSENISEKQDIQTSITIKKSTYKNLLKGIVVAIAIAAFFGGYSVGSFDNSGSSISNDELKDILSEIQNAPQPAQQPSQPLDDDPVKGNTNAPVTVVEFSDFQCPFCSKFFKQTLPLLEKNYIDTGKIKLVYRDLPIDSLHPNARLAHIASECADEQGKFWEYHDVLFQKQSEWQRMNSIDFQSTLTQYAADLGLQSESFMACLESEEIADEVNKDFLEAAKYGATGTPTFFIGNEKDGFIKITGAQPYAVFQNAIDNQLG